MALYDLLNEEDRVGFEPTHESDWVDSWEAALALFDESPWYLFSVPMRVHPDFAPQIWAAAQERFYADERHKDGERPLRCIKDWHRLCHGGGRASAYSDF